MIEAPLGGPELFYVAGDGQMMSVAVQKSGPSVEFGQPAPVVVVNWMADLKK